MTEQTNGLLDKNGIAKFLSLSARQVDKLDLPFIMVGKRKRFEPTEVLLSLKEGRTVKKVGDE